MDTNFPSDMPQGYSLTSKEGMTGSNNGTRIRSPTFSEGTTGALFSVQATVDVPMFGLTTGDLTYDRWSARPVISAPAKVVSGLSLQQNPTKHGTGTWPRVRKTVVLYEQAVPATSMIVGRRVPLPAPPLLCLPKPTTWET